MCIKQREIERKPRPFIFTDCNRGISYKNSIKVIKTFSVMKNLANKISLAIFAVAGIALTAVVGYALVTTFIWMQHN